MAKERGNLIHERRKALGLSMDDLAQEIGASRSFIWLLEKGKCGITAVKADRLAKVLGLPFESLFTAQGGIGDNSSRWLTYLTEKHKLGQTEQNLLVKFVRDAGLGEDQDDETGESFQKRWDAFYKTVCAFLPNPVQRFFADAEVRQLLSVMGLNGVESWREVREQFIEKMVSRVVSSECANGTDWRVHIEKVLGIETLLIDDSCDVATLFADRSDIAEPAIMGGVALVTSSNRMLGAVYRHSKGKYVLVEDRRGEKAAHRDFAFWHEATRVLVDPELKLGRGIKCALDGLDRTPIEKLVCRLAVWFAFGFNTAKTNCEAVVAGSIPSVAAVSEIRDEVYPQAPLWMTIAAIMDAQERPMLYVVSTLRLKHSERTAKGICIEETEKMRNDPDAKLRVAYVYSNIAAEESGLELRLGMRIGKKSPIYRSFKTQASVKGAENLADWDYDLAGEVEADATYGADGRVRALVALLRGGNEEIVNNQI